MTATGPSIGPRRHGSTRTTARQASAKIIEPAMSTATLKP